MSNILLVSLGGVLGSLSRYGFYICARRFPLMIPSGTLGVNVIGCLIAGALFQIGNQAGSLPEGLRLFMMVGFLGAFTTFSAFSVDTLALFQSRAMSLAFLNITANVVVSLAATCVGVFLVRCIRP